MAHIKLLALALLILPAWACSSLPDAQPRQTAPGQTARFPAHASAGVNPDTQLKLTFATPPKIGASGFIRIFDAHDNALVDEIDMSIPPSPRPTGRAQETTEAQRQALGASSKMTDFQVNSIGGTDFHFFPIIVRDNTATIYPHNNRLKYGRSYRVTIDPGVLEAPGFAGFTAAAPWTFTTKSAPPAATATKLVVAADGSGDFNTVQGAIDFAPAKPDKRITIEIRNGTYEEIVFLSGKSNLTFRGQDREKVVVGYPNNSSFNPPRGGPSRRPAFSIQNSNDIQLSTFTIRNHFIGQAEALLVRGERNIIDRMTLNGSGDALTTYGSLYMVDSKLTGDGDTILGYASLFCLRCTIESVGPFTWTRTPEGRHGNVFVDSTLVYVDKPLPWTITESDPVGRKSPGVLARLPKNGPVGAVGANFPHAEMVLINSRTRGVPPEGWGPVEGPPDFDSSKVRFWEFNTIDIDVDAIDITKRHPIVRQLTLEKDRQLIDDYRTPSWVLGGWRPEIDPN